MSTDPSPAPLLSFLQPLRPYFSFALQDRRQYERFLRALRPLELKGLIEPGCSRITVPAGAPLTAEAERRIAEAHLVFLLLSIDFFGCSHCTEIELPMAQARKRAGEAEMLPIHVRPCSADVLALYDLLDGLLPPGGKPISRGDRDRSWAAILDYLMDRFFRAHLRDAIHRTLLKLRQRTAFTSQDLRHLRQPDKEAWQAFMETYWPVMRQAWADAHDQPIADPSRPEADRQEVEFFNRVYERLFFDSPPAIHHFSPRVHGDLARYVYVFTRELAQAGRSAPSAAY